jgi:hypothetical protein
VDEDRRRQSSGSWIRSRTRRVAWPVKITPK